MSQGPLLFLAVCLLALSRNCLCDLSIRWAYNIPNAQILERLDVSSDFSFVVASVNYASSASLYGLAADPGTISGSLLWTTQVHSESANLGRPSISPDGNYVAVGCQNCQKKNAFVFAINGNSPTLIWSDLLTGTAAQGVLTMEGIPAWRPDSSFVYFQDVAYGIVVEVQISTKSITGRASVSTTSGSGAPSPLVSKDGKYLYACGASNLGGGALNQYTLPMLSTNPTPSARLLLPYPCFATGHLSKYSNMLYIGDNAGINAVDTSNGRLSKLWYYYTGTNVYPAPAFVYYTSSASPVKQVVAVTGSNVTAINADTGQYLWNALTDGQIQGAPVAMDNFVFVGSLGGDIASYDVNYQGSAGSGNPAWLNAATSRDKFVVDGPVGTSLNKIESSTPAIVFGTQAGTIWVLNSNTPTFNKTLPVWAIVLICVSCFIGGVLVSALFVCIARRRAAKNVDAMKKPLLSHVDAL